MKIWRILIPVLFLTAITIGIIGCFGSSSSDNAVGASATTLHGRLFLPLSENASRLSDSQGTLCPAAFADIWLEDRPDLISRSDASGSFSLENVPLGLQTLVTCLHGTGSRSTYKTRIKTLVVLADRNSISPEISLAALEITLVPAKNYVTGRLLNPDGSAFQAGVRMSLWGETFSVASGGYFTSPPLPDGIATATIFVAGTTLTDPIHIMAPFVSDVTPAYLEIRFADRGYSLQTAPCAALSSWKAGIQSNKCSTGETMEIHAEVPDPDKIVQGKATLQWETSAGVIASHGDSLHALWTAPSVEGVATITVTIQEVNGMRGITRLPILVGINTPSEDPTHSFVTLKSGVPSPTNASLIPIEILLSKPVQGFKSQLLSLTNARIKASEKIDELHYSITLEPVNQGAITVSLASDTVYDKNGNGNLAAVLTLMYDSIPPVVTVHSIVASDTSPELIGTVDDASATVIVTIDGGSGGSFPAHNNRDGFWSLDRGLIVPPLASGTHVLSASATDPVGNVGGTVIPGKLSIVNEASVVSSVTSLTPDGIYTIDHAINLVLNFSRPVISSGTVVLLLGLETPGTVIAQQASPSMVATTTHFFRYSVRKGDRVAKLDYHSRTSLIGEFFDALGIPANHTLPVPGGEGSLGDNANIEILTEAPEIMMQMQYANSPSPEIFGTLTRPSKTASVSLSVQILSDIHGSTDVKKFPATLLPDCKWLIPSGTVLLEDEIYSITVIASDSAGNFASKRFDSILTVNCKYPTVERVDFLSGPERQLFYKGL
ncbi:MAG: hypothetical protein WA705_30345 [Candidatus Ozemobacteraceae bacterium]